MTDRMPNWQAYVLPPMTVGQTFEVPMTPSNNERLLRLFAKAPDAFWRHDVDISLDAAVQMARIQQIAGVRGTYYILATGTYNPFSRDAGHHLNAIRSAGHRLGLHVDANDRDPYHAIDHAQRLFHGAYPDLFDLHRVSFHMPTQDLLWRRFAGIASAYAPEWEGRYVSDSRGEWSPEKEALVQDGWQVALHPEWWTQ